MKKYLVIVVILLISNQAISQGYAEKDITGKWEVVKILKKTDNPNFVEILKSFSSASFQFGEDGSFGISTLYKSTFFDMIIDKVKDAKWGLNGDNLVVRTGDDSNQFNILEINISKIDDKVIFHVEETELYLEVVKE